MADERPGWLQRVRNVFRSGPAKPLDKLGQAGSPSPQDNEDLRERIASPEGLRAQVSLNAGPLRTRTRTGAEFDLNPRKVRAIFDEADLGICYNYGDFAYGVLWRDGHIYASDRERRAAVSGKDFRVHAVNQSPLARSLRDFIQSLVDGIDRFDQAMYSLLSAPMVGYSVTEQIYVEGRAHFAGPNGEPVRLQGVYPRQLEWVHPKHFWFDFNEDFPLLDLGSDGKVRLDQEKFIYHRANGDGIVATRGWIRPVSWLHYFKSSGIRDFSVFLHLFGIPNIWAQIERSKWEDPTFRSVLEQALRDFGQGVPSVLFKDMQVTIQPSQSAMGNGGIHLPYIGFMNAEISKVIKGEVLTSEAGLAGNSYALSQTHQDTFYLTVQSDERGLARTMQSAFRSWIRVNRGGLQNLFGVTLEELLANTPLCEHAIEQETTPAESAKILSLLVNELGVPIGESAAYRRFGYSPPRPGERALRGKTIVIPDGALSTGATDAAGGVDNPKDEPAGSK